MFLSFSTSFSCSEGGLRFDINRYRTSVESGLSAHQQLPSSQSDSYGPVPKTHRIMTLADHISVSHSHANFFSYFHTSFIALVFPLLQHIITQDFAKSQDPSTSSSSTFQSSATGRIKPSNRYSPENPSPATHNQRPPSRVSPEKSSDKSRARYMYVYVPRLLNKTH